MDYFFQILPGYVVRSLIYDEMCGNEWIYSVFPMTKHNSASNTPKSVKNRRTIQIEWGDCDPAQIVFFPRYFAFFDACTAALFRRTGMNKREMLKAYDIIGIPMVDVHASFLAPCHYSDEVVIESEVVEWRRSSFRVQHRLYNKGVLSVECVEVRVWAGRSAKDPEKIEGRPIPQEIIDRLTEDRPTEKARLAAKKPRRTTSAKGKRA